MQLQTCQLTANPVPVPNDVSISPASPPQHAHVSSQLDKRSRLPPLLPAAATGSSIDAQDQRRKSRSKSGFVSPFKDCLGSFGKLTAPRFPRPSDGKVNGYIKFNWPDRRASNARSSSISVLPDDHDNEYDEEDQTQSLVSNSQNSLTLYSRSVESIASSSSSPTYPSFSGQASELISNFIYNPSISSQSSPILSTKYISSELLSGSQSAQSPRLVPPHFGLVAKMDQMDRSFWSFCKF